MSKKAFDKIMAGAEAALAYAKGDTAGSVTHHIETIDVAAIRKSLALSQAQFAARFGLDKGAVVEWEHGRRRPDRAARVLLKVIAKNPQAVEDALSE